MGSNIFYSAQQYIEYHKALYHNQVELSNEILVSKSPTKAAMLGETIECNDEWSKIESNLIFGTCKLKYAQCTEVKVTVNNDPQAVKSSGMETYWKYCMENLD